MKALLLTNEYPPNVYGGAGVHVDYLTRELAKHIDVDVRCFGDQRLHTDKLTVAGHDAPAGLLDALPKQLRAPVDTVARCVSFNATPTAAARCAEQKQRIESALAAMEPRDREVLALRHFEQLSNVEAAAEIGITEAATSKRFIRALDKMRLVLAEP